MKKDVDVRKALKHLGISKEELYRIIYRIGVKNVSRL
ncbi:hypothetical protein SAMN05421787_1233 [Virgibacillus pantothenticus]|nr:hypothetical protein SAMN05421787_1233 [Virgibacillus pantothenticus]